MRDAGSTGGHHARLAAAIYNGQDEENEIKNCRESGENRLRVSYIFREKPSAIRKDKRVIYSRYALISFFIKVK